MEQYKPPRLSCFEGARNDLCALSEVASCEFVLVVANETTLEASGASDAVATFLAQHKHIWLSGFRSNAQLDALQRYAHVVKDAPISSVVAVGGGTAIDIAKILRASLQWGRDPSDLSHGIGLGSARPVRLIAMPTTAGSGSEATSFAVMYSGVHKLSIDHPSLLPDVAIIDPDLTASVSPLQAASSGLDALCQSIESLWSCQATEASIQIATRACQICWGNIVSNVYAPSRHTRAAMCEASHLAGRAINVSRTTACHALSYGISASYGVPHGYAVAMFLSPVFDLNAAITVDTASAAVNASECRVRLAKLASTIGCNTIEEAAEAIKELCRKLRVPTRLRDVGVERSAVSSLLGSVDASRLRNNPRVLAGGDIANLLVSMW